MASQRAKPSLIGDLLIHIMNIDAENSLEHQNHGLLSPSTSISRSHEGGEEIVDPHGKPSILRLSSPELGENTIPDTQPLLTSRSLSCEHGQELKKSTKADIKSLTTSQTTPSTNVQIDVFEPANQQSTEVAQQPSSFPTPLPSTPLKAHEFPIELPTTKKPKSHLISQPSKRKKARRMAPPKKVPTPLIPLNVRILALADRHAFPYASIAPKHAFTFNALPETTIREACTLAGTYVQGQLNASVESDRFEARDNDGYVFDGAEMIRQEIGAGGDLYLIEEAINAQEVRRKSLRDLDKEAGARTPNAKKVKEPRKTPSQRNKEIAEQGRRMVTGEPRKTMSSAVQASKAGRAPRSESRRSRTLSMAPLELEDRPSSPDQSVLMSFKPQQDQVAPETVIESIESLPQAATLKTQRQLDNNGAASGRDVEATEASLTPARLARKCVSTTKPMKPVDASENLVQSSEHVPSFTEKTTKRNSPNRPAVASQHKLPPAVSKAVLLPKDISVVPDSQDQPSQSIDTPSRDKTMATCWTPINARQPPAENQHDSATRPKATTQRSLTAAQDGSKPNQPQFPLGRPDPYDISIVLSDDEYYSPRPSKTIMSSSIRKLGSAMKRTTPASAPIPRNSLLIAKAPAAAAAQEQPNPPVRGRSAAPAQERLAIPRTPLAHATHNPSAQTAPSSAPGPLLSSPTNHVAAALARGRAKARRQPQPECIVIEDSDIEVFGDVLGGSQDQSKKPHDTSKSLEASLPWSAPPLRLGGEDPFWTLRTTGRRTSLRRKSDVDEGLDDEINDNNATHVKDHVAVPVLSSGVPVLPKVSTSNISSFNLGSAVKDPAKGASQEATPKSLQKSAPNTPSQATTWKPPLLLVHGSSSSEQGVEEIGYVDNAPAKNKPESPRKGSKIAVIQGPSNRDKVEEEDEHHDFMAGHGLARALFGDEEPIEPRQIAPEDDGLVLPDDMATFVSDINELPDDIPATIDNHPLLPKEVLQLSRTCETTPKSNEAIEDTPPSGQPSKRKRDFSDGVDSEEERRIVKTAKLEAREAKKAEKKRLRDEKLAQVEQQKRDHQERLQKERERLVRLAEEKARRRGLELELVVSSPSKAAEMGLDLSDPYDSDEESELGSSPPERAVVPPVFEGSEDSLESKESEESQSWRELSKRHFSALPSSSLKKDVAEGPKSALTPALSMTGVDTASEDASAVLADHKAKAPQKFEDCTAPKERARHNPLEEWAFVETIMGASAYSPLQVHNRIHMQMVLANLQGQKLRGGQEVGGPDIPKKMGDDVSKEMLAESQPDIVIERQDAMPHSQSKKKAQTQESAEDDGEDDEDVISQHTIRSPAPSPKDLTVVRVQELKENSGKQQPKQAKAKNKRRKSKDNTRKKKLRRKGKPCDCKELKRRHAFGAKGGEQ